MEKNDIISTIFLYILTILIFIYYMIRKQNKLKYIFSISNMYIFQYAFILFIVTPFAFTSKAWIKLLGQSAALYASRYYPYLLKSIKINCFGFIIFMLVLMFNEFNNKRPRLIYKMIKSSKEFNRSIMNLEYIIVVIIWIVYNFLIFNGTVKSDNSQVESGLTYYINSAIQVVINMMTLYYGFRYINKKKDIVYLMIGIVCCFFMGKRATFILDILMGITIYSLYKRNKKTKKVLYKSFKYIVALIFVALIMMNIRTGQNSQDFSLLENLIYGNTFCDIRDGGMILYGFENNNQKCLAMGKTYLSAILSFIPSRFSTLRLKWDWGRYSTTTLLGWKNHPGLRGGFSMEGYLNFGVIGIIISQIASAYVYASLEKIFRREMINNDERYIDEKWILPIYLFTLLARRFTCSAGFFAVYVMIIFLSFNIMIGKIINGK